MKVRDLITLLQCFPYDADVTAYDPEMQGIADVTGAVLMPAELPGFFPHIELQTDER